MKQYCENCTSEMKNLSYRNDSDCRYDYNNNVYDSRTHEYIGNLIYCPNCGSIRIDLKSK